MKSNSKNRPLDFKQIQGKLLWSLIVILLVAPAIICIVFIIKYGVNVCFWDQWEIVPLFDKLYSHKLTFNDMFALHNEHRMFFPRIIMLSLGLMTHYNNIAEMILSWFLLLLIGLVLFLIYGRYYGISQGSILRFIPVVWLVFNLRQWGNLLWGFQITWFMIVLLFLLMIYLLEKNNKIGWRFIMSIICGVVASFSALQGILVWPVGLFFMILNTLHKNTYDKKILMKQVSIWIVSATIVLFIYFSNSRVGLSESSIFNVKELDTAIVFIITVIGNPLGVNEITCLISGILLLIIYTSIGTYLILHRDNFKNKGMPFISSLLLLVFLFSLMVIAGRAGLGLSQAMSSTYSTITILGIIALYLLILTVKFEYSKVKLYFAILMMSGLFITYATVVLVIGPYSNAKKVQEMYYLKTYQSQNNENLGKLYVPNIVRERAEILQRYDLNVFAR